MGFKARQRRPKRTAHEHKLAHASGLTLCGMRDMWIAHSFDPKKFPLDEGRVARRPAANDEWTRVDCAECWQARSDRVVHLVTDPNLGTLGFEPSPARWKVRVARCGATLDEDDSRLATTASWGGATCLDCLATLRPAEREHKAKEGAKTGSRGVGLCGAKPSSMHPWPAQDWDRVTCVDCLRIRDREDVPAYIEAGVNMVIHNALSWARREGLEIRKGDCSYCSPNGKSDGTICVVCAPVVQKDRYKGKSQYDADHVCADLLGVPMPWLIDFVTGFDGDGTPTVYREAWRLGRKMARVHKVGQ